MISKLLKETTDKYDYMSSDKNTEKLAEAEQLFRKLVLESYDLEEDFVNVLCEYWRKSVESVVETLTVPKRSRAASGKPKQRRKKSAYNVYVREMMKTPEIQELDHRMKMSAIAAEWKKLTVDAKTQYTDMANEENEAASVAVVEKET